MKSFCPQLSGFRRCNHCGREGHFGREAESDSVEEGRQQASSCRQNVCDDRVRGSRFR